MLNPHEYSIKWYQIKFSMYVNKLLFSFLLGILPSPVEYVMATDSAEYYPFYKYPEQIEKGTSSNKITIEQ